MRRPRADAQGNIILARANADVGHGTARGASTQRSESRRARSPRGRRATTSAPGREVRGRDARRPLAASAGATRRRPRRWRTHAGGAAPAPLPTSLPLRRVRDVSRGSRPARWPFFWADGRGSLRRLWAPTPRRAARGRRAGGPCAARGGRRLRRARCHASVARAPLAAEVWLARCTVADGGGRGPWPCWVVALPRGRRSRCATASRGRRPCRAADLPPAAVRGASRPLLPGFLLRGASSPLLSGFSLCILGRGVVPVAVAVLRRSQWLGGSLDHASLLLARSLCHARRPSFPTFASHS